MRLLLVAGLAWLLLGCQPIVQPTPSPEELVPVRGTYVVPTPQIQGREIPFEPVVQEGIGVVEESERDPELLAVTDPDELEQLRPMLYSHDWEEVEQIDLQTHSLLALLRFHGTCPGLDIFIEDLAVEERILNVYATFEEKPDDDVVAIECKEAEYCAPYHVVAVNDRDADLDQLELKLHIRRLPVYVLVTPVTPTPTE